MTTEQMRNRTKTVTRRMGWKFLKRGDQVQAVVKGMGLKKGEKVERICVIKVTDVRRESLLAITAADVAAEGYPGRSTEFFIRKFCDANRCKPNHAVTRIAFEFVDNV